MPINNEHNRTTDQAFHIDNGLELVYFFKMGEKGKNFCSLSCIGVERVRRATVKMKLLQVKFEISNFETEHPYMVSEMDKI